jgi:dTDP-3,4-didehydro-2,6-dideoxy-alpha-D-glucose 3-reductase
MTIIKVAVWGLGNHAKNRILPTISSTKGISLIGVCSRNLVEVEKTSKRWKCIGWDEPSKMLNTFDVDVVYISTPIGVHFQMAKQAIESGKHVWCEKPLTCSYEDTQKLISISNERNKVLTESFMYLYHPQFQRLKSFISNSKKINSVICRFGIPSLVEPGFRDNPELCGGALWDVGSYTTSAILSLFPDQKVEVLFSEILKKNISSVDNEGRALLRFSKGVTCFLEWGTGLAYRNEIDIWSADGSFFTEKIFSKPKGYLPQYKIRDMNGNEHIEFGRESEQFMDMFSIFLGIMNSKNKISAEKKLILKRAELLNEIVNFKGV